MRKAAVLYFIITVALSVSSVVTGSTSRPEYLKDTQVLILVGPQYGLPMVDQLLPALMHDLKEGGISLNNIFVEFLDLHRNTDPQYRADVIALLEHKLKEREPELIIAINQGAVDFIASAGKNLCPDVPLLIPILEKHPEWEGETRKLITLTTQQDAAGTLSYALKLFPETKRAVIIMGKDDHEASFVEPISVALDAVRSGLAIETTEDLNFEEMLAMISNLPANTIAFYGSYFHDNTGRSFAPAEVAWRVGKTANAPVFAFRDMHIVSGLAGGSVAITADMGRLAAQISLEYFDGNLVLETPDTNFDVPNFPLFNWMQLRQMGGDISALPENTIFLNRPLTIWEEHRETVITAAISFVLLVLMLIALAFRNRQQKKLIIRLNEAENILREREQKFKSVFESANLGKSITLPTGEINVNQAFCDMLGYSPGELRNTKWQDLTPEDEIPTIQAIVNPLLTGEKDSARFEKRYICKNGSYMWADVNVSIQRDENNKPLYFITTVIDITERKQAEKNLIESENQYRTLFENMNTGFVLFEVVQNEQGIPVDLIIKAANEGFGKTTGLNLKDAVGRHLTEVLPGIEKDEADWIGKYSKVALSGEATEFEQGSELLGYYYSISAFQAELKQCAVTFLDITERKQAEESIKAYSQRLKDLHRIDKAILEAVDSPEKITQEAILHLSKLLHCQRASVGIFDFEKKEVSVFAAIGDVDSVVQIGKVLSEELFGDLDLLRQNKLEIIEDSLKSGTVPTIIKTIIAEGVRSSINAPIVSPKGLIGVLSIGWDTPRTIAPEEREIISEVASQVSIAMEQARLLQATKRHTEELEEKVRLRTALLEASNKELEAFSYSVSHDLRAPLRHINGFIGLFNQGYSEGLPEKARHYLHTISGASSQMGSLIDALLQYSRTGRQEVRKAQADMNLLVKEVTNQLKIGLEERKINWDIQQLPKVSGDIVLLKQVWANLLENAVKYTRNQKTTEISLGCREETKEFVFWVKDNGLGFDMKYAHKLFGVFQRLHSKADFEGTGIGLANVQRIVHKHLGRVWAEAEPGKGATFFFSLPKITEKI